MPDGPNNTAHTVDSTTQYQPFELYNPTNVRDVLQRQIQATVNREVDRVVEFSTGDFDGRLYANYPGKTYRLSNAHGQFYHVVGVSKGGDLSVAGP